MSEREGGEENVGHRLPYDERLEWLRIWRSQVGEDLMGGYAVLVVDR